MKNLAPIVSVLMTSILLATILSSRFGNKLQDIPNERSLHSVPIPRIGGVGLIVGVLSGWALMFADLEWWIVVPLIGLFIISLLDDMHNLPVRQRFSAHIAASAMLVVGSGLYAENGIVVALVVVLLSVWMTNLYNFMDGSNGLAGGMAVFGFATYGIAALIAHYETLAMLNFCISSAALGFLFFNFNPARVFMGDAGSIPLGFLVVAMGLSGWQQGCWAAWFPVLVFSPFIVDASITLGKRTIRGVKITEAHREHYYQRAIQMGWAHRKIAMIEYFLMFGAGTSALWALKYGSTWAIFFGWAGIYAFLALQLDARWKTFSRKWK